MSTNVEWVTNPDGSKGETWPVVTGCSPVSPGCCNCYAARMAATRLKHHPRYEGLAVMRAPGMPRWTGEVRLNHDVLEQPFHWRKPRMIFVASMGDLFHEDVPFEFISKVFTTMKACRARRLEHIFLVLTKRPNRMLEYWKWWRSFCVSDEAAFKYHDCIWLGVSVENQATADERREHLRQTPAAIKYVSYEPALGPVDWTGWEFVNQIISGGESGPRARPSHPNWHRATRDFCQRNSIAYFMKQWGEWVARDLYDGKRTNSEAWGCLDAQGLWWPETTTWNGRQFHAEDDYECTMLRVGRKRAGRLLDDMLWEEYPKCYKD